MRLTRPARSLTAWIAIFAMLVAALAPVACSASIKQGSASRRRAQQARRNAPHASSDFPECIGPTIVSRGVV